jgi:hypothetical protein
MMFAPGSLVAASNATGAAKFNTFGLEDEGGGQSSGVRMAVRHQSALMTFRD